MQVAAPAARTVAAGSAGVLADGDGLLRRPVERQPEILLGMDGDAPLFALDLDQLDAASAARVRDGGATITLREAGARLSPSETGLAAYTAMVLAWHRRNSHCANCGTPTNIRWGGGMRECPNCGAQHFPRVDPVVIMTVESDGRLLLGRQAGWPPAQYSVLAGFVAPGESLEEAVAREVREESGIAVVRSEFVASQPWPFPGSLMLGFDAFADGGEPAAVDGELEDVRWFSADAVGAGLAGENPDLRLPPGISISHFLIERWHAARSIGA